MREDKKLQLLSVLSIVALVLSVFVFAFECGISHALTTMEVTCSPVEGLVYVEVSGDTYTHFYQEVSE